jgi:hypothetical protein
VKYSELTNSTVNSPPVAGISAISPTCVPKVESSSCPKYAARNIHRHCVQNVIAIRGSATGADCVDDIIFYIEVGRVMVEVERGVRCGLSIGAASSGGSVEHCNFAFGYIHFVSYAEFQDFAMNYAP